jgi:hypothetical protein
VANGLRLGARLDALGRRHPARAAAFWLAVIFACLYAGLTRGHFLTTDEVDVFQAARSLWEHGNLAVGARLPNVEVGRGGLPYGPYGVGQSVAALPLYVAGKGTRWLLERTGADGVRRALAGETIEIGGADYRWGGEVEIFFVNLFNAFVGGALVGVFFLFSRRTGASAGAALAAALALGLASYIATYATLFFQHSAEALLLLAAFLFLFLDAGAPSPRWRWLAGAAAGGLVVFRPPEAVVLPALAGYLAANVLARTGAGAGPRERLARLAREAWPLAAGAAAGVLVNLAVNLWKYGQTFGGFYGSQRFDAPLFVSLTGLLASPGEGVFLFTPLLLLLPWTLREFAARFRRETAFILATAAIYLLFHASYRYWHAQMCFGPRYLAALTPLLLLPLGRWLDRAGRGGRLAAAALAAGGLFVVVLGTAVNLAYAYHFEGYDRTWPPALEMIFMPGRSQLPAHLRALLAWDYRVDLWLRSLARDFGFAAMLAALLPLLLVAGHAARRLRASLAALAASDAAAASRPD